MRLTAEEVETAFVEAAREQVSGEPWTWQRVAVLLNERLADNLVGRPAATVGVDGPRTKALTVGVDGAAHQNHQPHRPFLASAEPPR